MTMEVLFAGVRVRELAPAVEWYSRLFGRAADIVPNHDEVMWRVTDGGWLYVIRDSPRAGNSLVTICVTDLDATAAALAGRKITLGPITPVGDAGRKATGEDPDGNSIDLIEVTQ
jgi:predicted enzyme related to lactoylglutathione lyase